MGPVWGFPVWGLLVRWYTTYTEIITFAVATEPLHSQVDPQQYQDHLHKTASPCPQAQRTLKSRKENVKEQTTPPQATCPAGSGFESDLRLKFWMGLNFKTSNLPESYGIFLWYHRRRGGFNRAQLRRAGGQSGRPYPLWIETRKAWWRNSTGLRWTGLRPSSLTQPSTEGLCVESLWIDRNCFLQTVVLLSALDPTWWNIFRKIWKANLEKSTFWFTYFLRLMNVLFVLVHEERKRSWAERYFLNPAMKYFKFQEDSSLDVLV